MFKTLFKYLILLISLLISLLIFLFATSMGDKIIKDFLSDYLTNKTHNNIVVKNIDFSGYPNIKTLLRVNRRADVELNGKIDKKRFDIKYHIVGDSFKFNNIYMPYYLDINGTAKGSLKNSYIKGVGKIFDGNSRYSFNIEHKRVENLKLELKNANSAKIFKYFHKKPILYGDANITANFKYIDRYNQVGEVRYIVLDGLFKGEKINLDSNISIDNLEYKFDAKVNNSLGELNITNGYYHRAKDIGTINYNIDIKELSSLQKYTKQRYRGAFNAIGLVTYSNKKAVIKGITHSFSGDIDFIYRDKNLDLKLSKVSLIKLLREFNYPTILEADIFGTISYDRVRKILVLNTKLKRARFTRTKMTDIIFNTTGIDIRKEIFNSSSFNGYYENNILSADLIIKNKKSYIFLKKIKMNSKTNHINSNFSLKIEEQELEGKIFGTLKNPKVDVDMSKLIKYQMTKQINSFMGNDSVKKIKKDISRVNVKSIKEKIKDIDIKDVKKRLKDVDIDKVKNDTKKFLKGFF